MYLLCNDLIPDNEIIKSAFTFRCVKYGSYTTASLVLQLEFQGIQDQNPKHQTYIMYVVNLVPWYLLILNGNSKN